MVDIMEHAARAAADKTLPIETRMEALLTTLREHNRRHAESEQAHKNNEELVRLLMQDERGHEIIVRSVLMLMSDDV